MDNEVENGGAEEYFEEEKEEISEDFGEGDIQHPYENVVVSSVEQHKAMDVYDENLKEPEQQYSNFQSNNGNFQDQDYETRNFGSFGPPQNLGGSHKVEQKAKKFKASHTQKLPERHHESYDKRPESRDRKKPRAVKSATRGNSENSKKTNNKIISNSGNLKNQKRTTSHKERKQKSSPIRTTKIKGKNEMGVTHYFTSKPKNSTGSTHKKLKGIGANSGRTGQAHPSTTAYKEPILHHANLIKAHNLNLSLNNYKTEMRLPHATKFIVEPQFAKSPFLSKTLKGMIQPKSSNKNPGTNYGRLGYTFQSKSGRKKRESSAHSHKSKREGSNSHKKTSKVQSKLFNTKKLSFNYNTGKQMQNLSDILSKNALNTSKIYSRNNDKNI